jgi:hypothetical protein
MIFNKITLRVKLFIFLTLLTAVSSVAMIFSGLELSNSKKELSKTINSNKNITKYSREIGEFRAKIAAQKKAIGGSNVEFSPKEIDSACKRNNAILDKTAPLPDIDRDDYLERGYRVNLNSIQKIDLGRLYADLETNIPGCKIKAHNMSALKTGINLWSVSFIIVKSVPKTRDEL